MNKRFDLTQQELKIAVPIYGAVQQPLIVKYKFNMLKFPGVMGYGV